MKRVAIALLVAGSLLARAPVYADTCPDAPDHAARLQALIAEVQAAGNEMEARVISNRMWEIWADAPNEQAQAILDRGMTRRASYDYAGALQDFNRLVDYCPDYAEGYNQRAFVNYLSQKFAPALEDLDRALALSPNHIAAMSGRALSLMALNRLDEAKVILAEALELNPWLPERGLAGPGGPLETRPVGEDI